MRDYLDTNRKLWDGWTKLHARSAFYDVDGFRAGRTSLTPLEREEVGDVAGYTLLHLQCHFGLDTLSWARDAAAIVTGVDFSPEAIILARSLSDELSIPATFICADLFDLPGVLDEQFDIVFTSYGVLPWLPDLKPWADVVAHFLKPGGTFYVVEFHPFIGMLDEKGEQIAYSYFRTPEPLRFEAQGSYADPHAALWGTSYEWPHTLGDVVTALVEAGLRIDYLHEFPYSTHPYPPYVEKEAPGRYIWKKHENAVPLLFSIRALKEDERVGE